MAEAPTPRADEMTTEQAGRAYVSAICKGNDASDEFSRLIWRGRDRIGLAEVRVRLPQLKRLAGTFGRALNKSARMLYNPDAGTWPDCEHRRDDDGEVHCERVLLARTAVQRRQRLPVAALQRSSEQRR